MLQGFFLLGWIIKSNALASQITPALLNLKHASSFVFEDTLFAFNGALFNDSFKKTALQIDLKRSFYLSFVIWGFSKSDAFHEGFPELLGYRVVLDEKFGKLYLVGGKPKLDSFSLENDLLSLQFWIYDFKIKVWIEKTSRFENSPRARYLHSLTIKDGNIYLFGGLDYHDKVLDDFHIFDVDAHSWRPLLFPDGENPPSGRFGHSTEIYRNKLVIIGGKEKQNLADINIVFYISTEDYACTKRTIKSDNGPVSLYGHTASVSPNDKIFIVGGLDRNDLTVSKAFILDLHLLEWTEMTSHELAGRAFHSASSYGQALFLLFGSFDQRAIQLIKMDTSQVYDKYSLRISEDGAFNGGFSPYIPLSLGLLATILIFGWMIAHKKSWFCKNPSVSTESNVANTKPQSSNYPSPDNLSYIGKFATGLWNTRLSSNTRFIDPSQQLSSFPNIDVNFTIEELDCPEE